MPLLIEVEGVIVKKFPETCRTQIMPLLIEVIARVIVGLENR